MASLPALGITGPGPAALAAGTSSAMILCYSQFLPVEGTTSITLDNTLTGLYGYASGQAAFGDLLAGWSAAARPRKCFAPRRMRTSPHMRSFPAAPRACARAKAG